MTFAEFIQVIIISLMVLLLTAGALTKSVRLRWSTMGAFWGGLCGLTAYAAFGGDVNILFHEMGHLLPKLVREYFFGWYDLYPLELFILTGMAAGLGVGLWMKREKAK
jgi:hypothetical protein